ncbi:hypothetical protein Fcan01_08611 [Folsomia candida]|uniref:Uncharacterized protein n=1 Tax=Folsomia candida TaxID=158441 RepID=A0A226EFU7_FOLCA|nr:hypothetical protein Fcan01_08611 [Folsomia candida]
MKILALPSLVAFFIALLLLLEHVYGAENSSEEEEDDESNEDVDNDEQVAAAAAKKKKEAEDAAAAAAKQPPLVPYQPYLEDPWYFYKWPGFGQAEGVVARWPWWPQAVPVEGQKNAVQDDENNSDEEQDDEDDEVQDDAILTHFEGDLNLRKLDFIDTGFKNSVHQMNIKKFLIISTLWEFILKFWKTNLYEFLKPGNFLSVSHGFGSLLRVSGSGSGSASDTKFKNPKLSGSGSGPKIVMSEFRVRVGFGYGLRTRNPNQTFLDRYHKKILEKLLNYMCFSGCNTEVIRVRVPANGYGFFGFGLASGFGPVVPGSEPRNDYECVDFDTFGDSSLSPAFNFGDHGHGHGHGDDDHHPHHRKTYKQKPTAVHSVGWGPAVGKATWYGVLNAKVNSRSDLEDDDDNDSEEGPRLPLTRFSPKMRYSPRSEDQNYRPVWVKSYGSRP